MKAEGCGGTRQVKKTGCPRWSLPILQVESLDVFDCEVEALYNFNRMSAAYR